MKKGEERSRDGGRRLIIGILRRLGSLLEITEVKAAQFGTAIEIHSSSGLAIAQSLRRYRIEMSRTHSTLACSFSELGRDLQDFNGTAGRRVAR